MHNNIYIKVGGYLKKKVIKASRVGRNIPETVGIQLF